MLFPAGPGLALSSGLIQFVTSWFSLLYLMLKEGTVSLSVRLRASSSAGAEVFCYTRSSSRRGDLVSESHSLIHTYQKNLSFPIYPLLSVSLPLPHVGLALYFYYRLSTQAQTDSLSSLRTASRRWQLRQAFLPSVFPSLSSSPEWRMATCSARDLFYRTNPSCRLHSVREHVQNLWNLEICTLKNLTISSGCELQC